MKNPGSMTNIQLITYAEAVQEKIEEENERLKALKEQHETIMEEYKKRITKAGVAFYGNRTVKVTHKKKFVGSVAKANLPADLYAAICEPAPNATRAKKALGGENSATYQKCLKDFGWDVTIHDTTDKEREIQEAAQRSIELTP